MSSPPTTPLIAACPPKPYYAHLGARQKATTGKLVDYTAEISEGMVVLDAVASRSRRRIGERPGLPLELQEPASSGSCSAEVNGKPKLMCVTRMSDLDTYHCPSRSSRCGHSPPIRDLVTDVSWNYRVKQTIKKFKPRKPDAPDGTRSGMARADVDRAGAEFPQKCIECFLCQDVCHGLQADHHWAR